MLEDNANGVFIKEYKSLQPADDERVQILVDDLKNKTGAVLHCATRLQRFSFCLSSLKISKYMKLTESNKTNESCRRKKPHRFVTN